MTIYFTAGCISEIHRTLPIFVRAAEAKFASTGELSFEFSKGSGVSQDCHILHTLYKFAVAMMTEINPILV